MFAFPLCEKGKTVRGVSVMDLFERIFHLSPDHGNGTLEVMVLVAVLAVPIACIVVRAALVVRSRLAAYRREAADGQDRPRITA